MKILNTTDEQLEQSAVTIGVFDGVHAGHQKLLEKLDHSAKESGLQRVVITFDKHPLSIIAPGHNPKLLMSTEKKLELIEQTGLVDAVVLIDFTPIRAAQNAEDFVKEIIIDQLKTKHIIIGENFKFGHERRGNIALLERMGQEFGFQVDALKLELSMGDLPISSTRIRQYISVGDVEKAHELLTRPHEISGVVVSGDNVGTKLGFPTANTDVQDIYSVPADGVYAGQVKLEDGSTHISAISIGVRPMFHDDNIRAIEPYLLDFNGDLYGQNISIEFIARLRNQLVLESKQALIDQIDQDVQAVRQIMASK